MAKSAVEKVRDRKKAHKIIAPELLHKAKISGI